MDVDTEPPMEGPGAGPQLYCKPIGVDADDASDGDGADASESRSDAGEPRLILSSSTAAGALRILKSCSKSLVMDLAFVLEGQSEEALPEKILGTVEWHHFDLDPDNSPVIKVCGEDN